LAYRIVIQGLIGLSAMMPGNSPHPPQAKKKDKKEVDESVRLRARSQLALVNLPPKEP